MTGLFIALLPILGVVAGLLLGRRFATADRRLSNPEKQELKRLRNFEAEALGLAREHVAYGDPLATKIIDAGRKDLS